MQYQNLIKVPEILTFLRFRAILENSELVRVDWAEFNFSAPSINIAKSKIPRRLTQFLLWNIGQILCLSCCRKKRNETIKYLISVRWRKWWRNLERRWVLIETNKNSVSFFWNEDSLFDDSKGIDDIENIRHRGTNYLAGKGEKKIWEYT